MAKLAKFGIFVLFAILTVGAAEEDGDLAVIMDVTVPPTEDQISTVLTAPAEEEPEASGFDDADDAVSEPIATAAPVTSTHTLTKSTKASSSTKAGLASPKANRPTKKPLKTSKTKTSEKDVAGDRKTGKKNRRGRGKATKAPPSGKAATQSGRTPNKGGKRRGQGKKTTTPTTQTSTKATQTVATSPMRQPESREKDVWLGGICSVSCVKFNDFKDTFESKLTSVSVRLTQVVDQNRQMKADLNQLRTENQQLKDNQHGTSRKMEEIYKRLHDIENREHENIQNARRWSKWSEWSSCSTTCDAGTMSRNRACEGDESLVDLCAGETTEVKKCKAKYQCRNVTLQCDVTYNGTCFEMYNMKRKGNLEGHKTHCLNGQGHLGNIYNSEHLMLLKEAAVEKDMLGKYIWTGMTYNPAKRQVLGSDGTKAKFVKWMHEFGAGTRATLTRIALHFDPHEDFRKENNFHVLNGLKNTSPKTAYQYSLCEFKSKN